MLQQPQYVLALPASLLLVCFASCNLWVEATGEDLLLRMSDQKHVSMTSMLLTGTAGLDIEGEGLDYLTQKLRTENLQNENVRANCVFIFKFTGGQSAYVQCFVSPEQFGFNRSPHDSFTLGDVTNLVSLDDAPNSVRRLMERAVRAIERMNPAYR